jgi:hypothetical protein
MWHHFLASDLPPLRLGGEPAAVVAPDVRGQAPDHEKFARPLEDVLTRMFFSHVARRVLSFVFGLMRQPRRQTCARRSQGRDGDAGGLSAEIKRVSRRGHDLRRGPRCPDSQSLAPDGSYIHFPLDAAVVPLTGEPSNAISQIRNDRRFRAPPGHPCPSPADGVDYLPVPRDPRSMRPDRGVVRKD